MKNRSGVPNLDTSEREMEHMSQCSSCCETWEFFYRENERRAKLSWEVLCAKWINIPEKKRELLKRSLAKDEKKWFVLLRKSIHANTFNTFSQSLHISDPASIKSKIAAAKWRSMTDDEKQPFREQTLQLRNERKANLKNMSPCLKRIYKLYRKPKKQKQHVSNAFFLYLKQLWVELEPLGKTYQQTVEFATNSWKTLETKHIYQEQAKLSFELAKKGFECEDLNQ
jgi:murein DD-endopeptidase MepM/ murein hydrolase activator NlpD